MSKNTAILKQYFMKKRRVPEGDSMKRWTRLLSVLLLVCLLLTACTSVSNGSAGQKSEAEYSQEVQNLEKLCKVWGYTKYTHPAFLFGEKDWDEELLNLIPVVSKAKAEEVNDILHEWFVSLGEIDYRTSRKKTLPPEEELMVQSDTGWIREDYLGAELTEDLSKLGPIPNIDRNKAPVQFIGNALVSMPDFGNERYYDQINYSLPAERLLGLFRVWNAMEYYCPYLDILDESWEAQIQPFITRMLEGSDQHSYEMTISALSAKLQDAHVRLVTKDLVKRPLFDEWGVYTVPTELIYAEDKIVVCNPYTEKLKAGDIILELDGVAVEELIANRLEYISVTEEDKLMFAVYPLLFRSHQPEMELKILRDGKEQTILIEGKKDIDQLYMWHIPTEVSHELLEGNIGLINPQKLEDGEIPRIMEKFRNTDGLIIDLRQYPGYSFYPEISSYLGDTEEIFVQASFPSQSIPGVFVTGPIKRTAESWEYRGEIVVLTNEMSLSNAEYTVMSLQNAENVTVMGEETIGADGNVVRLPLPGNIELLFTSLGVYTPEMGQTQRIGLSPDIEVYPTVEGIKEGRDELLEAAVAYIQKQNAK